jgi:hypothetical protein
MLKTVSSITNAIGALNYKGVWNASTNTPTIVSSVGVKGDYYVVSVAGTTTINGISKWGVGDWIVFNGLVWQRVEGGQDGNFTGLSTQVVTKVFADSGYVLTINDFTVLADATGGAMSLTMPAAASFSGQIYAVKKIDSSANAVTIACSGANTIDGSATQTLAIQNSSLMVQSNGTNWFII